MTFIVVALVCGLAAAIAACFRSRVATFAWIGYVGAAIGDVQVQAHNPRIPLWVHISVMGSVLVVFLFFIAKGASRFKSNEIGAALVLVQLVTAVMLYLAINLLFALTGPL